MGTELSDFVQEIIMLTYAIARNLDGNAKDAIIKDLSNMLASMPPEEANSNKAFLRRQVLELLAKKKDGPNLTLIQ